MFLIGSWARFDHAAYTWRTGSSQLLSGKWMRLGSNWFHIGVLAILGGHFVGLLTPHCGLRALHQPPARSSCWRWWWAASSAWSASSA